MITHLLKAIRLINELDFTKFIFDFDDIINGLVPNKIVLDGIFLFDKWVGTRGCIFFGFQFFVKNEEKDGFLHEEWLIVEEKINLI